MTLCPTCGQPTGNKEVITPQEQYAFDAFFRAFNEYAEQHKDDKAPEPKPQPKWPD